MAIKALVKKEKGVILTKNIDDPMEANEASINTVTVYKIATVSVGKEIRVWEFYFSDNNEGDGKQSLSTNFLANITGHESTTNIVRFSSNGSWQLSKLSLIIVGSLLASGDVNGNIMVWRLVKAGSDEDAAMPSTDSSSTIDDLPPNKEVTL